MRLRKLELRDAPLMLEWMHDKSVVADLQTNFAAKTLSDCENFIRYCATAADDLHLAITEQADEYLGTVSLKHIRPGQDAEFAITIRACAMGKGLSAQATKQILHMGLQEMDLHTIYWCVSPDNKRAVRFYDKNGYRRVSVSSLKPVGYTPEQLQYYIWYAVSKE